MARRSLRTKRIIGALAVPTFMVAVLVGCEFIVSNDLPTYTCTGSDPSSCPSGMSCNQQTSTCVSNALPGSDTGPTTEGGPDIETGPKLAAMGERCANDSACQSGLLCGTANNLTSAILTDQGSVCTSPCCTTDECPTGFICYPAATGGNYCVDATRASRTPPADGGGAKGGTSCLANGDCRSGLCGTDGHCFDTCCSGDDCNGGTICKVLDNVTDPTGTKHSAWACALPNASLKADLQTCSGDSSECQNNNCNSTGTQTICDPTCCSTNDCTKIGLTDFVCSYGTNSDVLKSCYAARDAGQEGAPCPNGRADCSSFFCDSQSKTCGRPCCKSSDCKTGESCKPNDKNLLRCVKNTP